MLVNFSNHRSDRWSVEQLAAAKEWGELVDFPFPVVQANATESEVVALAEKITNEILELCPDAVMCQGEYTLAFSVVKKLQERGVKVIAACSERITSEEMVNGVIEKNAKFIFVKFREYM